MQSDSNPHQALKRRFEQYIRLNITSRLPDPEPLHAEETRFQLSEKLMAGFNPVWDRIHPNPGGTMGHHARYIAAKADWLVAELTSSDAVPQLEKLCQKHLPGFWLEWAGYHLAV